MRHAFYAKTWAALIVLLVLTIAVAHFDLGVFSLPIALGIAFAKAGLIVLYFMHVRHGLRGVAVFACAAYLWLALLIVGTLTDYFTRQWVPGGSVTESRPSSREASAKEAR